MGIKGLAKLLSDEAPDCVREVPLKSLHGRKIAIDASMAIYQFLIAVRSGGGNDAVAAVLTNADGETTSHVQGMFNRTIRFLVEGVRPVFVFDGKPPPLKRTGELVKRKERREKAEEELRKAREADDKAEAEKQERRLVRAGHKENEDCIRLLKLMGVPVIRAPCEAEAQAAALARAGLVYGVGTEDMDALTFKAPILLRKMTFANANKSEIQSMNYEKALKGLELTHDQFVDLCILLGCDYCDSIRGVGPKTALKLVREYGCIEKILENLDRKKYGIPPDWIPKERKSQKKTEKEEEEDDEQTDNEKEDDTGKEKGDTDKEKGEIDEVVASSSSSPLTKEGESKEDDDGDETDEPIYVGARRLFNDHEVLDGGDTDLKWTPCQPAELTKFLVDEMGFNPDRVASNIEKLQKAYKATSKPQMRMDNFFKVIPAGPSSDTKRKGSASATTKKGGNKKSKVTAGKSRKK